ncbi:MAG: KH domain-containing protein [Caldisericia bacterium]|nr:KH domain-containing protein [Caldisericia bacterium]
MKDLLEEIVKALVDHPEDVKVQAVEGEQAVVYEVKVSADDIGKVIGKQGRTANALRTLVRAAASKSGKNAMVNILS